MRARDNDQDTADRFLNRFRAAWDAGDAKAFAALFTDDATYVTWLGDPLVGRAEVERVHHDVFHRWAPGTQVEVKALQKRTLGPDLCSVVTAGGLAERRPIAYEKLQSFTLIRREGRWLCAAFQNTVMSERAKAAFNAPPSGAGQ